MARLLRVSSVRIIPIAIAFPGRTDIGGRKCSARGWVYISESACIGAGRLTVQPQSGGRVSRPLHGRTQKIPASAAIGPYFSRRRGLVVAGSHRRRALWQALVTTKVASLCDVAL